MIGIYTRNKGRADEVHVYVFDQSKVDDVVLESLMMDDMEAEHYYVEPVQEGGSHTYIFYIHDKLDQWKEALLLEFLINKGRLSNDQREHLERILLECDSRRHRDWFRPEIRR